MIMEFEERHEQVTVVDLRPGDRVRRPGWDGDYEIESMSRDEVLGPVRIKFRNGPVLACNPNHTFLRMVRAEEIRAEEIRTGDWVTRRGWDKFWRVERMGVTWTNGLEKVTLLLKGFSGPYHLPPDAVFLRRVSSPPRRQRSAEELSLAEALGYQPPQEALQAPSESASGFGSGTLTDDIGPEQLMREAVSALARSRRKGQEFYERWQKAEPFRAAAAREALVAQGLEDYLDEEML